MWIGRQVYVFLIQLEPYYKIYHHKLFPNIKIIEVQNQPKWVLSWAFNLAARFTTLPNILKLDCDYVIEPDFITRHSLSKGGIFYTGHWEQARDKNESYLNGCLYLKKVDFVKVHGYNEYLQRYGYDDSDLYERLAKLGLNRQYINNDHIKHIHHETSNVMVNGKVNYGRQSTNTHNDIHFNRFLITKLPWTSQLQMGSFTYTTRLETIGFTHVSIFSGTMKDHVKIPLNVEAETEKELQNYLQILNGMDKLKVSQSKVPPEASPKNLVDQKLGTPTQDVSPRNNSVKFDAISKDGSVIYCSNSANNKGFNTLYVNVRNGLGNKLRAFASAYTLITYLNKSSEYNKWKWNLVVIWVPDDHCMAKFTSLFNHVIPNTTVVDTLPKITSDMIKLTTYNISDEKDKPVSPEISLFLQQIKTAKYPVEAYLESAAVIHFPHNNWKDDCAFLRTIKLSVSVQSLLNKTISEVESASKTTMKNLVGVHIRIGQGNQSFDNVSSWSKDKQDEWHKWRNASNIGRFVAAMKKELPNCKGFYVASDTESVYTQLQSAFPGKIFYLKRNVWGSFRTTGYYRFN